MNGRGNEQLKILIASGMAAQILGEVRTQCAIHFLRKVEDHRSVFGQPQNEGELIEEVRYYLRETPYQFISFCNFIIFREGIFNTGNDGAVTPDCNYKKFL